KQHNNSTLRAGITKFIFGGRSYGFICHACGVDSREEHESLMAEQMEYEPWAEPIYKQGDPADFLNREPHSEKLTKIYPLTDLGNAERFEQRFAGEFIWTKETGWLVYRDGVWKEDKTAEADQAMQVTVRLIMQEAELAE